MPQLGNLKSPENSEVSGGKCEILGFLLIWLYLDREWTSEVTSNVTVRCFLVRYFLGVVEVSIIFFFEINLCENFLRAVSVSPLILILNINRG